MEYRLNEQDGGKHEHYSSAGQHGDDIVHQLDGVRQLYLADHVSHLSKGLPVVLELSDRVRGGLIHC